MNVGNTHRTSVGWTILRINWHWSHYCDDKLCFKFLDPSLKWTWSINVSSADNRLLPLSAFVKLTLFPDISTVLRNINRMRRKRSGAPYITHDSEFTQCVKTSDGVKDFFTLKKVNGACLCKTWCSDVVDCSCKGFPGCAFPKSIAIYHYQHDAMFNGLHCFLFHLLLFFYNIQISL